MFQRKGGRSPLKVNFTMKFRSFSVALIGPDGAGKSTISRALVEPSPYLFKVIYMGDNIEACNFALPTSRLVGYFRRRRHDRNAERSKAGRELPATRDGQKISLVQMLWALGRLVNFLAEEWYRQLVSWSFQARGYIVLYDRHFLFDFSLDGVDSDAWAFERRLHRWILERFYPRPNLVIYLDAPSEVLFARKREKTPKELEDRRQAFIRQGTQMRNFVQVDCTQPFNKVCAEVCGLIAKYSGRPSTSNASGSL
jgi:thymidylate kinase